MRSRATTLSSMSLFHITSSVLFWAKLYHRTAENQQECHENEAYSHGALLLNGPEA